MIKEELIELYKEHLREGLSKYTRKAYEMLPELNKPRILDIGCGSGASTIELARLCNGHIIGLDIDQPLLDKLRTKAEEAGFSNRVKTLKSSMFQMDFADESFDIIWSEGSIFIIGFEKGLKEWRHFLKPNGFLVVHDESKNTKKKLKQIPNCGYNLLEYFSLPEDAWWVEYYDPLEQRIQELRTEYIDDTESLNVLDKEQDEIDMFKKYRESYGSVFFIMQKK